MSRSAPSDLAVAFRSVPRRLREALDGCEDPWSGHARIAAVVGEAAAMMHCASDPVAVADAIDHRHAADWDESDIDRLQALALQLGALVRQAEAWRDDSPAD